MTSTIPRFSPAWPVSTRSRIVPPRWHPDGTTAADRPAGGLARRSFGPSVRRVGLIGRDPNRRDRPGRPTDAPDRPGDPRPRREADRGAIDTPGASPPWPPRGPGGGGPTSHGPTAGGPPGRPRAGRATTSAPTPAARRGRAAASRGIATAATGVDGPGHVPRGIVRNRSPSARSARPPGPGRHEGSHIDLDPVGPPTRESPPASMGSVGSRR